MKHIARIAFAVLIALWSVTSAHAEGSSYRLEVDGLACPFCAYGVEKKLNALDGVERLETNIKEGAVIVTMKDGAEWGGPFAINVFGPFNGWFSVVTSVAIGPDGNVFVADIYNDRVQKFAPDGTFLTAFGEAGDGPGQFRHAIAVDVADDGTVFVADFRNNRVQKWRPRR